MYTLPLTCGAQKISKCGSLLVSKPSSLLLRSTYSTISCGYIPKTTGQANQECYKSSKILQNFKHKDFHNLPYLKFQSSFSRSHVIRIARIFRLIITTVDGDSNSTLLSIIKFFVIHSICTGMGLYNMEIQNRGRSYCL